MKSSGTLDPTKDDFYNPHSTARDELRRAQNRAETDSMSQHDVDARFASITQNGLRDLEETGDKIAREHSYEPRQKRDNSLGRWRKFAGKNLKSKGPMAALLFLLFGGGGFLTVLLTPSLAIIEMKEALTHSLNDQLHAMDERSQLMMRAKMKSVTKGSCGLITIRCRFTTMSNAQVAKFEKENSGIKIEREKVVNGRGQISKITFVNDEGVTSIESAKDLHTQLVNNPAFRAAWIAHGYNAKYMGFSDKLAMKVLSSKKATKSLSISGDDDEERQKKLNDIAGGVDDGGARTLIKTTDKDGKEIYVDENGEQVDPSKVESARENSADMERLVNAGGTKAVIAKSVSLTGSVDNLCTAYNSARRASALAKVIKKAQAIRFALALVLTPADQIKAGDAKEGDITFSGNNLMTPQPANQVVDDSKLGATDENGDVPTTTDPEAGGTAFDSPGMKIALYGDAPTLSSRASRFMLGAGSVAIVDAVIRQVAKVVNGGDPNPKQVSRKCGYVQNTFVRVGSFIAGLAAGVSTFGVWTAVGIGASVATAMALPWLEAHIGDIMAGNIFKDISGLDSGDASYVGMAGLNSDLAQNRGMEPVTTQGGAEYVLQNQQTIEKYAEAERYMARSTPFDITNPNSFLGSIAYTLMPTVARSQSNASMAMMSIVGLIPSTFASITQPAKALSADYFDKCNDPILRDAGILPGPFCEVRFWMSDKELAMDPVQNLDWMISSGNVDEQTGEALDNKQNWNYTKFLAQCAHRTNGYGENESENEGDGTDCYAPKYQSLNEHFRVYTMDKSISDGMEDDGSSVSQPGSTGFTDGQSGLVGDNHWAFPTIASNSITLGFETSDHPEHKGLNIAAATDTETLGQPIFAAYDGTVVAAGPSGDYGNWIVIEHDVRGGTMTSVYGYMENNGISVRQGQKVSAGDEIGHIGSRGGKPYLYFELWRGKVGSGARVDPTPYVEAARKQEAARNV